MTPAARASLARWYRIHGQHNLPWRQTTDPYAILVSEVMLQQTQVDRVIPYYRRWLDRWPTVDALARATPADAIREWAGLGYNRRALYLHRAAIAVLEKHDGILPRDLVALRRLPGVGPYTAAALASFAFGRRVAVIETNVARVIARARLGLAHQREANAGPLACAAESLLPRHGSRDHNLALMDLGALICTARDPACGRCPLRSSCSWLAAGRPPARPAAMRSPAFESTARYARGRIVAVLREHEYVTTGSLREALPREHQPRLDNYLEALVRDGLVVRTAAGWSFPSTNHES